MLALAPLAIPPITLRLSPQAMPSLSVVVVNYRHWELTARLVHQLGSASSFQDGSSEVVVVDNNSPEHRLLSRLRRIEGVSVRRWGRNRGFARAVNEGVRLSQGGWILLLNPDVTVPPGFLDRVLALTRRIERDEPRTGIVGLALRDPDGQPQPSAGPFPTLFRTLGRLLLPRRWRKYNLTPPGRQPVDWVSGCCLLVRRPVLRELGGLDPNYFLYYEDADLCRRARERGWTVRYEPDLFAVHHHPLHDRPVLPHIRLMTRHSLLTYAARHWPAWQSRWLGRIVRLEATVKRWLARLRGDKLSARWMRRLDRLAGFMQDRRFVAARRLLRRCVEEWESWENAHAAGPVACHPEPQPARSAPSLSVQRSSVRTR